MGGGGFPVVPPGRGGDFSKTIKKRTERGPPPSGEEGDAPPPVFLEGCMKMFCMEALNGVKRLKIDSKIDLK